APKSSGGGDGLTVRPSGLSARGLREAPEHELPAALARVARARLGPDRPGELPPRVGQVDARVVALRGEHDLNLGRRQIGVELPLEHDAARRVPDEHGAEAHLGGAAALDEAAAFPRLDLDAVERPEPDRSPARERLDRPPGARIAREEIERPLERRVD